MTTGGAVPIQGCAIRISRLNADGSVAAGATAMVADDKPFLKWTAKPAMQAGVEIVPISACGAPLISYKDYDRVKRWDVTLDLGDLDFEKKEILQGGTLLTAPSSTGRTFADGITTSGSNIIGSASLSAFTAVDIGRTVAGTGIPVGAVIISVTDGTHAVMSAPATATASGVSVTLGALTVRTIGYQPPALLSIGNPNGVAIEIWQKAIVRGTGYQGILGAPGAGSAAAPTLASAWIRWGWFRVYLFPADMAVEDKESQDMYTGWAIENPSFGTGPKDDWRTTGVAATGTPLDTTKAFDVMADFQLPTPLQPGYQTLP